jgi:hypothetical protein
VAQHRANELREKALDEIAPRALRGCGGELEAAHRLIGERDQLDCCVSWIGGIVKLEKFDEFAAAMTVPD